MKCYVIMAEDAEHLIYELLQCKDCRFSTCIEEQDDWWECEHDHRVNHGNGFCNWAEEREEE